LQGGHFKALQTRVNRRGKTSVANPANFSVT